jgi:DNA-binding response OmpR family regulator
VKILVVEDDARLSSVIERAIRETGWTVETAHDGLSGDHLLRSGAGDAAVLDLGLPGRSGLDLLRRLRASGSTLPVLVLTGRDALEERIAGLDAGADDYIIKPFDPEELRARISVGVRVLGLQQKLAERVAELETLQRIDQQLNTGLDLDRVLDLTLDWALRGTQADSGWIALRPDDHSPMVIVAGDGKGAILNAELPDLAPAAHEGRLVVRGAGSSGLPPRLVAPLRRETRTIALIGVQRRAGPFAPEAEAFLLRLAEHSALALENTRLYQAVQQANLTKSQFVSLVSHELKSPMTSIRGFADLIRQGMTGPVSDVCRASLTSVPV